MADLHGKQPLSADGSDESDLVIVSGLSGSGKSVALQSLEDIGYYCVDNLPAVMLPEFVRHLPEASAGENGAVTSAAVSIDSRNNRYLDRLDEVLRGFEQGGHKIRVLFLNAEEQKLVRRYSETRRKHPLTDDNTPLVEGIRLEREVLKPLLERAEKIIDTTDTTPHELRGLVRDFAGGSGVKGPLLLLESFGFKHGSPREADFIFDVRCLPNPHWEEHLRALTGLDKPVQNFLADQSVVAEMTDGIFAFLHRWLPGFASENRSYITVGIGCTGGRHRSVYISEQLVARFRGAGLHAQVRHQQLERA